MRGEDMMGVAPGVERQRRRVPPGLPIALGALAGLALCTLGYIALLFLVPHQQAQPNVQPTANTICVDLLHRSYDQLYTLLDSSLQEQGTQAQFVASQRQLDTLLGPVSSCAPSQPAIAGATATLAYSLTRTTGENATVKVTLIDQDGSWRISSYNGAF